MMFSARLRVEVEQGEDTEELHRESPKPRAAS